MLLLLIKILFILYLTFKFLFHCPPRCPRIAYNVVAASRRRGFHKGSRGRQTSKFPQNYLRAYTPACVKPLVMGSAFFALYVSFSHKSQHTPTTLYSQFSPFHLSANFCLALICCLMHAYKYLNA